MIPIPQGVTAFVARLSLSGIALAIMAVLLAVQTARVEGLSIWPVKVEGWKPKAERLLAEQKAAQAAYRAQADRAATIANDYEKGRDNASQANAGRIEKVRTIYRDVAVSVDCAAPDAVRSVLAEAVDSANASAGR